MTPLLLNGISAASLSFLLQNPKWTSFQQEVSIFIHLHPRRVQISLQLRGGLQTITISFVKLQLSTIKMKQIHSRSRQPYTL